MQKRTLASTILAITALLPLAANAAPSYTYLDLSYVSADLEDGPTIDGFGIDGSLRLSNELHFVVDYQSLSKNDVDLDLILVGPGYNQSLSDTVDLVVRAGWARAELGVERNGRNSSNTDNGLFGQAGLRGMVSEQLELNGFLTYIDAGDSTASVDLGGVYFLTPAIGVTLDASFSDDANVYRGGVRFAF